MNKKLYTYGLILILLVSTTGLTITWHLCKTLNVINTEACGMEDLAPTKMSSGCCEKDKAEVTISGYMPVCCEIEMIENKVSDQFLFVNIETNKNTNFIVILIKTNIHLDSNPLYHFKHNLHNTSPPHIDNDIYLQNSILLI
ncbi:MAG: hypothetical protein IIA49_12285 [Bacteroidetes bacterium]|nr:hypothetical protein [Bacteroidota bacterium]